MRKPAHTLPRRIASPLILAAVVGACAVSAPAFAGHGWDRDDDGYDRRDDAYAPAHTEFAQVLSTRPIVTPVQVSQPRRECYDQPVAYQDGPRYSGDNTAGAVIGAVIGGVVGNQFGHGGGRVLTTGLGAVIGANVGAQAGQYERPRPVRTGYETRCQTYDDTHVEDRVSGYDVTYRYHGDVYHTTMPYDPGDRVAVDVSVRPVRY